jgi:class IV lanthipeptide synthase
VAGVVPWLIGSEDTDLPGLHFGRAGVAVALAEAVAGGLVERSSVRQFVREALEGRLDWLDITHGASGQGIAAICCGDVLGDPDLTRLSQRCAEYLLNTQNPDGSWTIPEGADGISGETLTGFAHGVAGMVYFLAGYSARTRNIEAARAAEKGARWLLSQAERANGIMTWQYSNRDKTRWHWWCHGGPGIALAFLKLFEVTGEPAYADVARAALHVHPANRRHPNLSVCHGLAGLGEIYLEAAQILKDEEWQHRAQRLAELLIALARTNDDGSLGWIVEDAHVPTADLMVGSGGVMHFLLRVHTGGHIGGFPLLLGSNGTPLKLRDFFAQQASR